MKNLICLSALFAVVTSFVSRTRRSSDSSRLTIAAGTGSWKEAMYRVIAGITQVIPPVGGFISAGIVPPQLLATVRQ